jgi:hypothetical protein
LGKINAPGQGRKPKAETLYKEMIGKYAQHAPQFADEMTAKALPQSLPVTCPKCKHEFVIEKVPGTGDKDVLFHIEDRLLGKTPIAIDQRTSIKIMVSAEDYERASRLVITEEKLLLNEGIEGE